MAVEVTISIKSEDSTYKQKFLVYEDFKMSGDDPLVMEMIKETQDQCKMIPDDIKVRAFVQVM